MKKLLLASIIGLMFIVSAYATCNGGTEITNTGGTTFCQSNVKMNWWTAAAWCKENGMSLATIYEMCPSWDGNEADSGICLELSGAGNGCVSSGTARGNEKAFVICPSLGRVTATYRNNYANGIYAFCR